MTALAAATRLHRMIDDAATVVAFTGAGISTECGVPDFRSPGSPWTRNPPIPFAQFMAGPLQRAEAWRRKFAMDDLYAHARPGRGHRALARLAAAGKMPAVVTQNIDGLHQASGLAPGQVVELHGNGTYAACLDCGARHELAAVRPRFEATGAAPVCACGGIVKSATVAFGQAMPAGPLRRARELSENCDLMLVLGCSLAVQPANRLPLIAKRAGALIAIVNNTPTPLDGEADLVLRGDIGTALDHFDA